MEKAAGVGDWDTVRECMHPEFVLYEPPEFPFGGAYRGVEGLQRLHAKAAGILTDQKVWHVDVLAGDDPDRIVCYLRLQGKVVATGAPFDSTILELIEFRGGKVLSGKPHWFDPPDWG